MFKTLFIITSLFFSSLSFAVPVQPETVVAVSVKEATLLVEKKCTEGCLVLSPQDLANIESNIAEALNQAYKQGLHSCRNSI